MHSCTNCIPFHPILVPLAAKNCKMQSKAYPIFFDIVWPQKKGDYETLRLNSSVKNAGLLTTAPWFVMIQFREVSSQDLAQNCRFPGMGTNVDRTKMARFFLLPLPQSHVPVSVAWCTHGRGAVLARTWACLMARRQPASPSLDSLTRIKAEIEPGRHMEQLAIIYIWYIYYIYNIFSRFGEGHDLYLGTGFFFRLSSSSSGSSWRTFAI